MLQVNVYRNGWELFSKKKKQKGSGKTLAFAVPVVEILRESYFNTISCLCVLPTKDLAAQVYEVFCSLCDGDDIKTCLLSGERPFIEEQNEIAKKPHIVVCTPGRLKDHLQSTFKEEELKRLRWLVIDEGDRLLSQQYHQWISELMPHLEHPVFSVSGPFPSPPLQKLVFSATMTSNPRKLALLNLYRPTFFHAIEDESYQGLPILPAQLSEYKVVCASEEGKTRKIMTVWCVILPMFSFFLPSRSAFGFGLDAYERWAESSAKSSNFYELR